jgi:N-acyl-L-homoserine lactone synthetase
MCTPVPYSVRCLLTPCLQEGTMENLETRQVETNGETDFVAGILGGYRFKVCETPDEVAQALEIRRRVYVDDVGYDVPVPDALDGRSWLLLAIHEETGEAVGSMRITPRFAGSFELEEYFTLTSAFRSPKCVELNRFAILPAHRKGKTFLPVVSLGMFKLAMRFLQSMGMHQLVIASKPQKIWTYEWLGFTRSGRTAAYGTLDAIEHELLTFNLRRADEIFAGHPFEQFFCGFEYREVIMPERLPEIGIGIESDGLELRKSA